MTITVKQLAKVFDNINEGKKACPYCDNGDCMLSCENCPCAGTEAEQSECAYRS